MPLHEMPLHRDRILVLGGLLMLAGLAWAQMLHDAQAMSTSGICECFGMAMNGPGSKPWSISALGPLFLMWAMMMVAMMVPSVAPVVLRFTAANRERGDQQGPYFATAVFLFGYLSVWTIFSVAAALAHWMLQSLGLLSEAMIITHPVLSANVLIMAGVFQFTPLKAHCLEQCCSPLSSSLPDWREGTSGAFLMGLKQGTYCTGCCWLLMLLLFVAGVMNMWWVAGISLFVLAEKLGARVHHFAGVALVIWGVIVLLRPLF